MTDLIPLHDKETCSRAFCGRCKPQGKPQSPPVGVNPHDADAPVNDRRLVLAAHILADELEKAAAAIRTGGVTTTNRFTNWQPAPRLPRPDGRDDEDDTQPTRSDLDDEERRLDAQAARYLDEWVTLSAGLLAGARRATSLVEIAKGFKPKPSPANEQGCELCTSAGLKKDGKPIPYDHTSNVGERLRREMRLCAGHYQYVWKHDAPPTDEQTRHWWTTGTWKVKVR